MKRIIALLVIAVLTFGVVGCSRSHDANDSASTAASDSSSQAEGSSDSTESEDVIELTDITTGDVTKIDASAIPYGEVVEAKTNDGALIIEMKVDAQASDKMTVDQNYYNVEGLVKRAGGDQYDEIQYWAIADTTDGDDTKIISFTVPSDLIQSIADGKVPTNRLGSYVDDLYILPSLQ